MLQTIAIEESTLHALKKARGLTRDRSANFFPEWQSLLPQLSDFEQVRVARIRATYENLENRAPLGNTVGLTILSPLLDTAGLFLPPFYIETEKSVQIVAEEGDTLLKGRLDITIIKDLLWVLTIESKRAGFSLIVGIPQVLSYMMAAPTPQKQLYGMVTNGRNFVFVKLERDLEGGNKPIYAQSKEFILNQDDDLEETLRILKRIGAIAAST